VSALFRRPLTQVGLGVVAGGVLIAIGAFLLSRGPDGGSRPGSLSLAQGAMILAHSTLMFGVCLLACVVPTQRALRVEPSEALRVE
jgi:putative ABC transport system permease protein